MATILLVDDSEDNLTLTSLVLEKDDHSILTARNGRDALRIAQQENPDVVLLDIQMPIMDGFEVCRRLKADSETANIPVLFLTAKHKDIDSVSSRANVNSPKVIISRAGRR